MTAHTVRYVVRRDQAEQNEELLWALFRELDEVGPPASATPCSSTMTA